MERPLCLAFSGPIISTMLSQPPSCLIHSANELSTDQQYLLKMRSAVATGVLCPTALGAKNQAHCHILGGSLQLTQSCNIMSLQAKKLNALTEFVMKVCTTMWSSIKAPHPAIMVFHKGHPILREWCPSCLGEVIC